MSTPGPLGGAGAGKPAAAWRSGHNALLVGLLVSAFHVAFGPDVLATLGTLYDDVVYLSLGKALAEGEGYRSIHLVGAPVHVKFPPLLPASYAALWLFFGTLEGVVYGAYTLSMLVLAGGTAALWHYSRAMGIRWWLMAFFAIGPLLLIRTVRYFAGAVSEPWFLAGWATALVLVHRLTDDREGPSDRTALLLGLVVATTVLARTQAVVLLPAILGALYLHKLGIRTLGIVTGAAILPLAIWKWAHRTMMATGTLSTSLDQSSYLEWMVGESPRETLSYLGVAFKTNPPNYLLHAANLLVGWASWKAQLVVLVGFGLTLIGMVWSVRRQPELALSVAAVTTVLVFWPFNQARFLTTLVPVAGVAAAYAIDRIYDSLPKMLKSATVVGCTVLAIAVALVNSEIRRNTYDYQASEGSLPLGIQAAAAWIESNTDPADYVLADYAGVYFLRTGRRTSIGFPEQPFTLPSVLIPPGRHLARQLLADSVDYVVDARPSERRIALQVAAMNDRCPAALRQLDPVASDSLAPRYYLVKPDQGCLTDLASQVSPLEAAKASAPR